MQYSAEFIILAPPFDSNFQITWQKITSWEKWILRIKPRWLPFILDSPTSAPRGQRLLLQPVQKTGNNPRVPVLLILDILWLNIKTVKAAVRGCWERSWYFRFFVIFLDHNTV